MTVSSGPVVFGFNSTPAIFTDVTSIQPQPPGCALAPRISPPDSCMNTLDSFLNAFRYRWNGRRSTGDCPPLGADGIGQVQRGSAVVTIHVLADRGLLLLLARVLPAPATAPENFYRRLLEASFLQTGDAAFAIHDKTGDVYLRILRSLDMLDY